MKIAYKFYILLGAFLALFSALFIYKTYNDSKDYVNELMSHEAELALQFDLSIRKYVAQNVRPLMYKLLGAEEFVPEVMASSFVARSVFEDVQKKFPELILKFSSDNPRNPLNMASPQELEIIKYFNNNPDINEWKGALNIDNKKYLTKFLARRMESKCLECHGDPTDAPKPLLAAYGDTAGFNKNLNEVVALNTIAIPAETINEKIWSTLKKNFFFLFAGLLCLFVATYLAFRFTVSQRLSRVADHFSNALAENNFEEIGQLDMRGGDEISSLSKNFNILAEKLSRHNMSLVNEIQERILVENELKKLKGELEERVDDRTKDLHKVNKDLKVQIKEKNKAQESIKQSHAELDQIFNTAAGGMRVIDKNFNMLRANDTFLKLADLKHHEEWQGEKCYEVFPGEFCHTSNCPLTKIKVARKDLINVEAIKERIRDGSNVHCLVKAVPFYDYAGAFIGIVEDLRDISERIRAENKLKNALSELKAAQSQMLQREKMASVGQLAAGVAHEINNPVGFVASNLSTLSKYIDRLNEYVGVLNNSIKEESEEELKELGKTLKIDYIVEDVKDLVNESLEGTGRVSKIVQGLKSFSRVDVAEQQPSEINECLESTINIVWNELKYKVTLNKDYGDLPLTKCYSQQLNQVFMNLLVNASHAIEKQGEINIKTWHQDDFIFVSISDTGSGIPKENLNKLFEPFFTTKEIGKGTGLGLSIVYDIIKKHEGDVSVKSELGEGTTFTIKLPVVEG